MIRSESLFGKRETQGASGTTHQGSSMATNMSNSVLTNTGSGSSAGSTTSGPVHVSRQSSLSGAAGNASALNSAQAALQASASNSYEIGSKLIVGANIKLKGLEITDCDTLVVEGRVEATMNSRVIQIAENGSFKGSAGIDIAEIRGEFEGDLTVRQKLVIYSTGKVFGKIRYGKVVIEEGGQISGDVQMVSASDAKVVSKVEPA